MLKVTVKTANREIIITGSDEMLSKLADALNENLKWDHVESSYELPDGFFSHLYDALVGEGD